MKAGDGSADDAKEKALEPSELAWKRSTKKASAAASFHKKKSTESPATAIIKPNTAKKMLIQTNHCWHRRNVADSSRFFIEDWMPIKVGGNKRSQLRVAVNRRDFGGSHLILLAPHSCKALAFGRLELDNGPMSYVMVDIEADGPIPSDYSMICLGAVIVEPGLARSFYGQLRPISESWIPEALAVSGFSREETQTFDDPEVVMRRFSSWLSESCGKRKIFISDNNGFDWSFINWYFHHFTGGNPFGFSSQNLGSLYKGLVKDTFQTFKHLRKTAHTHHPVDDARGNAEALLAMKAMDLKIKL